MPQANNILKKCKAYISCSASHIHISLFNLLQFTFSGSTSDLFCLIQYRLTFTMFRLKSLRTFYVFLIIWMQQPGGEDIGLSCCGGGVITTWAAGVGVIAAGSAV